MERGELNPESGTELLFREAWAAAWLREFRCMSRYQALLLRGTDEPLELRFAWLEWWDAACVCREAAARLETLDGFETFGSRTASPSPQSFAIASA